jgi:hypothetical protein
MATPLASLAPPEEFFQGLEKYFANDLEGAKKALTGDDLFSKSLLTFVEVKLDDISNTDEIQARIDGMDFKGNDIALMFCVLAQEYLMHNTKAHNLLLKRFGKQEKVIGTEPKEEEMPELEDAKPDGSKNNAKPDEYKKEEESAPKPESKPGTKQVGGKRKTRKATSSLLPKKRRVSRGKA